MKTSKKATKKAEPKKEAKVKSIKKVEDKKQSEELDAMPEMYLPVDKDGNIISNEELPTEISGQASIADVLKRNKK